MLVGMVQFIIDLIAETVNVATLLLPVSPFIYFNIAMEDLQFMRGLAWVLPMNFVMTTLGLWLVAFGQFYSIKFLLRKLKMIK